MSTETDGFDAQVDSVAALGEPNRRALYRFVVAQPAAVSRDHAAAGVGVARHVAKFHLDKLEFDGLLDVEYSRPAGRSGPGAGRPAKLYRRADRDFAVSLPGRRYDLAARVMAQAITTASATGAPLRDALADAARETGQGLGRQARHTLGARPSRAAAIKAITQMLESNGYEPRRDGTAITLANCPFHSLSQDYTELVCGMNLDLIEGLVQAVDTSGLRPALTPAPNQCCVSLAAPAGSHPAASQ
ncbi:MAG: transcriptional regulator [Pseudonocardiales bacterium]|nr:MAG: transcriptional regulator [Pseudonocardiales bacterium]